MFCAILLSQSWKVALGAEFILLFKTKKSTNVKTKEGIYQEMRVKTGSYSQFSGLRD